MGDRAAPIPDRQRAARDAALARCVGDVGEFVERHWARAPLYRPGADPDGFADLLSLGDVDNLVSTASLRFPAFRLVKDGKQLDPARYTKSGRIGSRPLGDIAHPGKIDEEFAGGATIVLQSLHRYWAPLTRLARELELALTHPIQVNAYITPAAARGLGVHHDEHDVLVLQVYGRKLWEVFEPAEPGAPRDATGAKLIDAELAPGDALYIPRQFPHAARTAASASAHLTVGVITVKWATLLRDAVGQALDGAFAEPLPVGFAEDPSAIAGLVKERLGELKDRLDGVDTATLAERAARRFWSGRPPLLTGQLEQLLVLDALDDRSVLRRRPDAVCRLERRGDRLKALLGDRVLDLPAYTEPALALILARDRFTVADLAAHLDEASRLVLARRLVREGLLEAVVVPTTVSSNQLGLDVPQAAPAEGPPER